MIKDKVKVKFYFNPFVIGVFLILCSFSLFLVGRYCQFQEGNQIHSRLFSVKEKSLLILMVLLS